MKYLITFLLIISVSFAARYYALLDMSGTVQQIIVADPDVIAALPNAPFYVETTMDGSLHGPYAGIGYTFNMATHQFVPPVSQYASVVITTNNAAITTKTATITIGSPIITTNGSNNIYIFKSSGSITF